MRACALPCSHDDVSVPDASRPAWRVARAAGDEAHLAVTVSRSLIEVSWAPTCEDKPFGRGQDLILGGQPPCLRSPTQNRRSGGQVGPSRLQTSAAQATAAGTASRQSPRRCEERSMREHVLVAGEMQDGRSLEASGPRAAELAESVF